MGNFHYGLELDATLTLFSQVPFIVQFLFCSTIEACLFDCIKSELQFLLLDTGLLYKKQFEGPL